MYCIVNLKQPKNVYSTENKCTVQPLPLLQGKTVIINEN